MNKKLNLVPYLTLVALVFAVLLPSCQAKTTAPANVNILFVPSAFAGRTLASATVYSAPDSNSQSINMLDPGTFLHILGLNESGKWIAIAQTNQPIMIGWISKALVEHKIITGTTRSLVLGYQKPDSSSMVIEAHSPAEVLNLLGRDESGTWFAVTNSHAKHPTITWVAPSDLDLPDVVATTASLTKFYLTPDTNSLVTNVLPPTYQVIVFAHNNSGSWLAAEDIHSNKFIGWVQVGDLKSGVDQALLPILPPVIK